MQSFLESVNHYCEGLTVAPGPAACCDHCRSAYGIDDDVSIDDAQAAMVDEGSFSWSQCDSCGSMVGGDRYDAHGILQEPINTINGPIEIIHLSICTDCLLFHANGDVPENWE